MSGLILIINPYLDKVLDLDTDVQTDAERWINGQGCGVNQAGVKKLVDSAFR